TNDLGVASASDLQGNALPPLAIYTNSRKMLLLFVTFLALAALFGSGVFYPSTRGGFLGPTVRWGLAIGGLLIAVPTPSLFGYLMVRGLKVISADATGLQVRTGLLDRRWPKIAWTDISDIRTVYETTELTMIPRKVEWVGIFAGDVQRLYAYKPNVWPSTL